MTPRVFVDTAGLYALADHRDPARRAAESSVLQLMRSGGKLILTDYIIDEATTLARVRAGTRGALGLLEIAERSEGFLFEWIGADRFETAKAYFRKHADHSYSFTDCTSFVVMRELGLTEALTTDHHFAEAGFKVLLPMS